MFIGFGVVLWMWAYRAQVKLQAQVRGARQWLVVVDRGGRLAAGPARLLLRAPYAALVAGVPPRLLAVWELSHLRYY